jgi:hypothetical protein
MRRFPVKAFEFDKIMAQQESNETQRGRSDRNGLV